MIVTVLQAFLATTLGAIFAIPASFLAAKNLTGKSKLSIWLYFLSRSTFNILRSIEALLYAAIFVFWVGIGPFAGMMALAVTTFALIGKLFSEAIENIENGPIEAVNSTGANRMQLIVYCNIPANIPAVLILPDLPVGYQHPHGYHHWIRRWWRDWVDPFDLLRQPAISQSRDGHPVHCDHRCTDGSGECKITSEICLSIKSFSVNLSAILDPRKMTLAIHLNV